MELKYWANTKKTLHVICRSTEDPKLKSYYETFFGHLEKGLRIVNVRSEFVTKSMKSEILYILSVCKITIICL
jgi:hypothetical protein